MSSIRLFAGFVCASVLALAAGCGQPALDLGDVPQVSEAQVASTGGVWVRPAQDPTGANVLLVNGVSSGPVSGYDWRALNLSTSQAEDLNASLPDLLLYGRFAQREAGTARIFQVVRAYRALSTATQDDPRSDSYMTVQAAGEGYSARLVGSPSASPVQWQDLDLTQFDLVAYLQTALVRDLQAGKDVVSVAGVTDGVAVVTQVFRPLHAPTLE